MSKTTEINNESISSIISKNLKQFRNERRLSLDALSTLSGVSKGMLNQIEKGDVNPTVTTLWKIANGLKVPFSDLINEQPDSCVIIKHTDVTPLCEDNGKHMIYPIFPYNTSIHAETYYVEVEPEGHSDEKSHSDGAIEQITIFQGELTIYVNQCKYVAKAGSTIKYQGDKPHYYLNSGKKTCKCNLIIFY